MAQERILVVEDESITAVEICQTLAELGYEPLGPVSSGRDAVARALELQPDLVLMDITLKGQMDGIEAAEIIRTKDICPVVFVTAHSDKLTLNRAKISAPFGYVLKPIAERDLHTAVEMALYRQRMEEQLREARDWSSVALRNIDEALVVIDRRGAVSFVNPAAEALLGWPEKEALGRAGLEVFDVIREELPGLAPDGNGDKQVLVRTRGQGAVSVIYRAVPVTSETEEVRGMVLIFRAPSADQQQEEAYALHLSR